jgi:ACS family tartrate transporter-like MFS transporter
MRLLPFLLALFVVAFIDRTNLGFAALTMNRELAISSQQFGFAAGIFFWGYFLFEVPSNLILHKIGARVWIARILITWGAVATLTGFVQSASQLYLARFALGLAEAGYFPGIVLYLGYWFRQREKAQAIALILAGIPLASILGAPISGFILDHAHWFGLSSWRWLLILEGFPAIAFVSLTNLLLPSRPAEARFLSAEEKAWIARELEREDRRKLQTQSMSVARTLVNPRVWHLACIGFGHGFATYTFSFWLPQIMKSVLGGRSNTGVGFAVMVPNLLGLIAMILVSRHSDRTAERRYHMAASGVLAGIAMLLLGAPHSAFFSVVLSSAVAIGAYSFLPVFFSMPGEFLTGFSAAAGIALMTSVANFGGFVGPYTVGLIQQKTGNLSYGLTCAGILLLISAGLALVLRKQPSAPERFTDAGGTMNARTAVGCRQGDYLLGSSDSEHQRLIRQARQLTPVTESFFREAGIGPGQHVLDVGSGVGDVAMLVAQLVGPSGQVVAIERDARSVSRARSRAAEAGLHNVQFVESDIAHFTTTIRFDAAVGRYILQFLPDPVVTLRSLAQRVRPGGIIAFQEGSFAPFVALSAHVPLWSAVVALHHEVAVRVGVNTEMGPALHKVFRDAGLPAPSMRLVMELGHDPDFTRWLSDVTISIRPKIEELNLSLDEVGDLDTLHQRLHDEVASSKTVVPWLALVGAWCRTRAD